jgi:hypothetical protein
VLIYVHTIRSTEAEPTTRENPNATEQVYWIIRKRVRRASTNVVNSLDFTNQLEVLVDRKIKTQAGN